MHKPCRACWLLWGGTKERGDGWSSKGARPSILCLVCPRGAFVGEAVSRQKITRQQSWALGEADGVVAAWQLDSFRPRGEYCARRGASARRGGMRIWRCCRPVPAAVAGCSPVPSSLGEKRAAACRVSAIAPLVPLVPSCIFIRSVRIPPAGCPRLRPKQPSSHTCCQGKVSCLEGSLHARGSLLCLPAAEMPTRLLPRKFVGYHGRDQNHPGSAMPLRDASDVLYQNPKAWFWLPCPAAS